MRETRRNAVRRKELIVASEHERRLTEYEQQVSELQDQLKTLDEEIVTIRPQPAAIMSGIADWMQ